MATPKTRITITIEREEHEILSIKEGRSGDLILFPRHGSAHDHPDGSIRETREDRISIHASRETDGNTIIHHLTGKDGSMVETASFLHNTASGFAWHVISKKCQSLAPEKYLARPRGRDRLINIGSYDPKQSTLLYSVFVADSHRDLPSLPCLAEPYRQIEFSAFRIFFFARYLSIPSLDKGTYIVSPTSRPRLDKEPPENLTRRYMESIPYGRIAFSVYELSLLLREAAIRHVGRLVGSREAQWARAETSTIFATAPEMSEQGESKLEGWLCPLIPVNDHLSNPVKLVYRHTTRKGDLPNR